MIPKTEIRYSMVYNRMFDKNFSLKDLIKLRGNCKKFGELFNKNIDKILKLTEKNHKKEWQYNFIPIYIVKEAPYCFSDPLTLKYYSNEKMMLVCLAHELLHNNFAGKWKFKDSEELHKYMEPLLNKIISELNINLKQELNQFNKKTMELAESKK